MRIEIAGVYVDDQAKALKFYTDTLGFVKQTDLPAGEFRWLTVASPDRRDLELVLEPNAFPAAAELAKKFQATIHLVHVAENDY